MGRGAVVPTMHFSRGAVLTHSYDDDDGQGDGSPCDPCFLGEAGYDTSLSLNKPHSATAGMISSSSSQKPKST